MTPAQLRQRFRMFARDVVLFAAPLFRRAMTFDAAKQLIRSARGAASMYRASGRSRSHREFTSTIAEALEEADEAQFWLEHLLDCKLVPEDRANILLAEASELTAILTKSFTTARENDERLRPRQGQPRRQPGSGQQDEFWSGAVGDDSAL